MTRSFHDKVIFITGAAGGIASAIAEAFAEQGAKVALVDKDKAVHEVGRALSKISAVISLQGDVSDLDFVCKSVEDVAGKWNSIDVLVNGAAILGPVGLLPDTDHAAWLRTLQTNLLGTYYTMHEILPLMIKRNRGKIINFAGGGAAYSYPRFTAYAASKVAVVRLTETVADEVSQYNIQANVIAPGAVETNILREVRASGGEVRTVTSVDKPVKLVLFLASHHSDHISGRFIHSHDEYEHFEKDMDPEQYKLRRIPLR
jgi:NAD(P)-dependent dehydrogenase (short-subunit alcohol dehydrogenase family)